MASSMVLDAPGVHEAALARLESLGERARDYLADSHAANTRRAYAADWRAFTSWYADHGRDPLPATPATLTLYLTAPAEALTTSTLGRRLVVIARAHRAAGHAPPTEDAGVRAVRRGIRRRKGTAQVGKAAAAAGDTGHLTGVLRAVCDRPSVTISSYGMLTSVLSISDGPPTRS